jgi:hypothetical protein
MALLRVLLLVVAALMLPPGLLILAGGHYQLGLSGVLVGVGALLMGTWAWGYPTAFPAREWVCIGVITAGAAVAGLWWFAVAFPLGVFLFNVLTGRLVMRRMGSTVFERVGPDAVMPGAEGTVAEFEAEGFRRVGGYRARLPIWRKVVVGTVLAGPEGDRFAIVTDRVWEVVSRFGHRWLVTTSGGIVPLPNHMLRQVLARARPAELVRAHQVAFERVVATGTDPDWFADDAAVLEVALALEADAAQSVSGASLVSAVRVEAARKSDDPPLADDDLSRWRLDAWLYSAEPAP